MAVEVRDYSQCGEARVISRLLERMEARDGWCCEFGAADGYFMSNTRHLIDAAGYNAVLIEPDRSQYEKLARSGERVLAIHGAVGWGDDDSLDVILAGTQIPTDFDVLSIDIDGNDYHVWDATQQYRPKIVVIEYNPTVPNAVEFVQERAVGVRHGSGLRSIWQLGASKGYAMVGASAFNVVFLRADIASALNVRPVVPEAVTANESYMARFWVGYDGTLFNQPLYMPWHPVVIRRGELQVLPRLLRMFPDEYGFWRRVLFRCWSFMRWLCLR